MWNRVVLLLAGVALGWNAVNSLVAADSEVRRYLTYVVLGTAVGVGYSVVLGIQGGAAGPALFTFVVAALVGYSGSARQASRVEEALPRPHPEVSQPDDNRLLVLLVADGEPAKYDGPAVWARHFQARSEEGHPTPNWFTRPLVYARIRRAYRRMGMGNSVSDWLTGVAAEVSLELDETCLVETAFLFMSPSVASALLHAVERGARYILVVPFGGRRDFLDAIRSQVVASHVLEAGAQVVYCNLDELGPVVEALGARLDYLSHGEVPPSLDRYRAQVAKQVAYVMPRSSRHSVAD